ncbi:MAG: macrocin O-methyltransferase [Oscillatoriales cyanobacterium SM2_2_1]|nr:macrocin O-methyltransferase [Oscillatoriales cyanobacterium SM2_2_1]
MNAIKREIKKIFNVLGYDLVKRNPPVASRHQFPHDFEPSYSKIISHVSDKTMTSPERLYGLLMATKYVSQSKLDGAIVECGTWKGGSMMATALMLRQLGDVKRDIYLFDTYEGMSPPTEKDRSFLDVSAEDYIADDMEVYIAPIEEVRSNLESTNYPKEKLHFIKGKVEDTIPEHAPEKIALLRLDTDWYESTKHELEHLFCRLVYGGVLIIDDYGFWKGCKQATDEFFNKRNIQILLNRIDETGRLGIKVNPC